MKRSIHGGGVRWTGRWVNAQSDRVEDWKIWAPGRWVVPLSVKDS